MKIKIITDSSANITRENYPEVGIVPLRIYIDNKEYIDDEKTDTEKLMIEMEKSEKSTTSCPSPQDWLEAFEGEDYIFAITISSALSGSYNSAMTAKKIYEESNGKKVHLIDSLSAGPHLEVIIEKLRELIGAENDYDTICRKIDEYLIKTGLVFVLKDLNNLAKNGRVSKTVAKIASVIGIQIVGKADEKGQFSVLKLCRGEKKTLQVLYENMKLMGYDGKNVRISHCRNEKKADMLKEIIRKEYKNADIKIGKTGGLCSYYAQTGGLMVGFEL